MVGLLLTLALLYAPSSLGQAFATDSEGGQSPVLIHIVSPGDSIGSLALLYNLPESTIRSCNGLSDRAIIFPNQRLLIPGSSLAGRLDRGATFRIVDIDDTLASLSVRTGVEESRIARLNGMISPYTIKPGTYLSIPAPGDSLNEPAGTLRAGSASDMLRVAIEGGVSPYQLLLVNHLSSLRLPSPTGYIALPEGEGFADGLDDPWAEVSLIGAPLTPGRSGAIHVTTTQPGIVTLYFLQQEMPVFSSGDGLTHDTIFGINRYAQPGVYDLRIGFTDAAGQVSTLEKTIMIIPGEYPSEVISLKPEIEAILTDAAIVEGEVSYIASSMTGFSPEKLWQESFIRPSLGILTSTFGTSRTYDNTSLNTYHSGSDLAVDEGTPVIAPASGYVIDTGELDVRGYIIMINHGRGVYTGYWHLASISVRPGDFVTAGQQIGTVGNTGASTSAHLHWEMRVNGVLVDAMQWLRVPFP